MISLQDSLRIEHLSVPMQGAMDHTNVYVLQKQDTIWLIDTGIEEPGTFAHLTDELAEVGIGWEQVTGVLLTHHHPDHTGLIPRIRRKNPRVQVRAHPQLKKERPDEAVVRSWFDRVGAPGPYQQNYIPCLMDSPGWKHLSQVGRLTGPPAREGRLHLGPLELEVLHTPGHTPDHLCFFLPGRRILFSGDHLLPDETPNVGSRPGTSGIPLQDYLENLERLVDLDAATVYPGHGEAGLDPNRRIHIILKHHRQRLEETLAAVEGGARTVWEISQGIRWREGRVHFLELDPRSKYLALSEAFSHVQYLVEENRLEQTENNSTQHFQLQRKSTRWSF